MVIQSVKVPDIGSATQVEVIEVAVKVGDEVHAEDTLLTLESEKASMDIPAPFAGKVSKVHVKPGDKVSQGTLIADLEVAEETEQPLSEQGEEKKSVTQAADRTVKEIVVPDIGNVTDVDVIEIAVKPGDEVKVDDPLITLESEKATMDVPAPIAGKVKELKVNVGDKVSQGTPILELWVTSEVEEPSETKPEIAQKPEAVPKEEQPIGSILEPSEKPEDEGIYAGPAVRRLARELDLDLTKLKGSGRKGRITKEDVQQYVKSALAKAESSGVGIGLPQPPAVDFKQFGDIEIMPLNRIKRLTGINLQRNWLLVPHVTQFDEADITELEQFRQAEKASAEKHGIKLTPLVFIMKAVVKALQQFPTFNASLDPSGESLILKKYYHIGVAVDTPNGLVVPVIRDVDNKGIYQLAQELAAISQKAREKGLAPADMQGSCFTISSLGGIGGTAFTPIVNMPDVAILGVSKAIIKPVYHNDQFVPRRMLPLSLSYDHRVIDGAEGAQFITYVSSLLADIRRLVL